METNNVTEEKSLSPEEIEVAYEQQLAEFDRQIKFFKKQLELEQIHRDIAEARLKTTVARVQLASFMNPSEESEEEDKEEGGHADEKATETNKRRNLKTS